MRVAVGRLRVGRALSLDLGQVVRMLWPVGSTWV